MTGAEAEATVPNDEAGVGVGVGAAVLVREVMEDTGTEIMTAETDIEMKIGVEGLTAMTDTERIQVDITIGVTREVGVAAGVEAEKEREEGKHFLSK